MRGKLLARIKEDGETLVVKCGFDERDILMQVDPVTFYTTGHYRGYPSVLVRLPSVDPDELHTILVSTWRSNAPKALIAAHDREHCAVDVTERKSPKSPRRSSG